jgi:hypothetical protein
MARKTKPRWTIYEQQVFELFKDHLPSAKVRKNVHVKGRFSKRKRQIDILIAEKTAVGILKTVIDTKLFNRKVDVKAVDALAGIVDDVGAEKGMLITSRGYTQGSGARAAEGGVRSDTGALIRISRFRLRYSRIQAALCAGSR